MPEWITEGLAVGGFAVALAAAIIAFVFGRRQANVAEHARLEAQRSADAAEASALAAQKTARIEARRDHLDYGATKVEVEQFRVVKNRRLPDHPSYVAALKNEAPKDFTYEATVQWSAGGRSPVGMGTLHSGGTVDIHLGIPGQDFDFLEVRFNGECACQQPDASGAHWVRRYQIPEAPDRKLVVMK